MASRQLRISYVSGQDLTSERVVDPLGLIEKRSRWYLVAGTPKGNRTFRLDRVQAASQTGEAVVRPPDFDLAEAWERINADFSRYSLPITAIGWCNPGPPLEAMRYRFGNRITPAESRADGRVRVEIRAWDGEFLARELAGFGDEVLIVEPSETVSELGRIAERLVAAYGSAGILPES